MVFAGEVSAVAWNESPRGQQRLIPGYFEGEPLTNVLHKLARKVNADISYKTDMVPLKRITYRADKASIYSVLDAVLKATGLYATLSVKHGFIKKKKLKRAIQLNTITGKVTDSNTKETLASVNIKVKGTTNGTFTDGDGHYSLELSSLQDSLVFSFVGYQKKIVPIDGRTEINVSLQPQTISEEEMVVTAFGEKQRREDLVGSVTTVTPSELAEVPTSNLTTALAGRVSGIIAYQRSGEPGQDNAQFFIRGVTTFGYKKNPLILIDGIESSTHDLARLQADDVESFSILKDATSTAVYGSRAANGVILINTKEGKKGKTKVDLRLENSISTPTKNIKLADPISYMQLYDEAVSSRDPLAVIPYSQQKIDKTIAGNDPFAYPATNWKDELFKDYAINQRLNLSVSGGGDVARYYVSGSLNQDNGMLKVDPRNNYNNNIDLKSYSLRTNVNVHLTKSTQMDVKLSGSFDDYTGPLDSGTDIYKKAMHTSPVRFAPYYPKTENYQYVNHTLFGNSEDEDGNLRDNPYADMVKGYRNYSRSQLSAQFGLNQDLTSVINGLNLSARIYVDRYSYFQVKRSINPYFYQFASYNKNTNDYNLTLLNEESGNPTLSYNPSEKTVRSNIKIQSKLNYKHTFLDKHDLGGLLVFRLRNQVTGNATDLQTSLPHRNLGLSGRVSYDYDKRYYVNFNFGYNGSERFYKTHRYGFFPSIGAAWNISNENFWKPLSNAITNLRIRATYGLTGNDAIGRPEDRFLYLSNVNLRDGGRGYTFGRDSDYFIDGISISRYSNRRITWEKSTKTDLALNLGLFNNLDLKADYFRETRSNILQTRAATPASLGLSADPQANIGKAESQGLEASLDYKRFFGNTVFFKVRGNFTYAHSKYITYEEPVYRNEPWKSREGNPITQQYGYIAERLFVDDAEAANAPEQNFGEYGGGDIKYRDVNGDGQITQLDQVPIGYPTSPEIVYGFGFSLGYKNLDLSVFFQGLARESFWMDAYATAPFVGDHQLLRTYAQDHWSENNQDLYALWPKFSGENDVGNDNNFQRNTWFMRNGSFLRLKQVEIGYNLPQNLLNSLSMRKFRIYLNSTNLLTWSKFKLWDPEMGGSGLGYPIQKVFNVGIQASF